MTSGSITKDETGTKRSRDQRYYFPQRYDTGVKGRAHVDHRWIGHYCLSSRMACLTALADDEKRSKPYRSSVFRPKVDSSEANISELLRILAPNVPRRW